jgi:hypothetical protein
MSATMELPSNLDDAADAAPPVAAAVAKRVRIILEDNPNIPPNGQFFGVNGRTYMLQTGVPVDVPPELIDVLDHAVETVPVVDNLTKRVIGHRSKHRYPYRRVGLGGDDRLS